MVKGISSGGHGIVGSSPPHALRGIGGGREAVYSPTELAKLDVPGRERYTIKQLNAPDASCEAPGDAIFADQFE